MKNRHHVMTVLIADDDTAACEALASILGKKYPAVVVLTAADGKTALESFRKHRPDIVITDIIMPEMGGIELARECRKLSQETKLIVLTGLSDLLGLETAALTELRIDHSILKPVIFSNLFAALDQAMAEIDRAHALTN